MMEDCPAGENAGQPRVSRIVDVDLVCMIAHIRSERTTRRASEDRSAVVGNDAD